MSQLRKRMNKVEVRAKAKVKVGARPYLYLRSCSYLHLCLNLNLGLSLGPEPVLIYTMLPNLSTRPVAMVNGAHDKTRAGIPARPDNLFFLSPL
jgi:hypothetical protein